MIHVYVGSNSNLTMEQFVAAVKTSITNGPASTRLHNANCKDGDTKLLDNLHSLLEE